MHGSFGKEVLAVCDKELCGKTLKGASAVFVVSESFYKGSEISVKDLKARLREFENINIVGNRAVAVALEEKIVSGENVVEIAGVKHVQIFKL